jgi:hypothetical protein
VSYASQNPTNALVEMTITYNGVEGDRETRYAMQAQILFVEATLYVNAFYTESSGDVLPLPEGWVVVDDPANFPEFEVLDLDGLLENFGVDYDGNGEARGATYYLIQAARDYATTVTLEAGDLNGTPVDMITLTLGWAGIAAATAAQDPNQQNDPIQEVLAAALAEAGDLLSLTFYLDAEDHILQVESAALWQLENLDIGGIQANLPEGSTFSLKNEISQVSLMEDLNPALEPFAAPEVQ